jgi:hypothetical protein
MALLLFLVIWMHQAFASWILVKFLWIVADVNVHYDIHLEWQ